MLARLVQAHRLLTVTRTFIATPLGGTLESSGPSHPIGGSARIPPFVADPMIEVLPSTRPAVRIFMYDPLV
jgi:creatinine amidohydrolase/Fe(II)-dependent formamide hydrolase-like protein